MEPGHYFAALRKRWVVLAVVAFLGMAAAVLVSLLTTPKYAATTTVFFGGQVRSQLVQGQNPIQSFASLASKPVVLAPVIGELGLQTSPEALARTLDVQAELDTVLVEITATSTTSQGAADIANRVAGQLELAVEDLSRAGPNQAPSIQVDNVAPAAAPRDPYSPNLRLNLAAGLIVGLAAGGALAVLRDLLDRRVRTEQDVQALTDVPVLGTLAMTRGHVQLQPGSRSLRSEAVRRLRTNLLAVGAPGGRRALVLTSPGPAGGTTTTAVDLAIAVAESGLRVLLVDADLRRPVLADRLGLDARVGLTSVLLRPEREQSAVQAVARNLDVLTSGEVPANPSEVLGSETMAKVLANLTHRYDLVLLDSSPLLSFTDAAVLSQQADGALIVVDSRTVEREQLTESLRALELAEARAVGIVLNTTPTAAAGPQRRSLPALLGRSPTARAAAPRPALPARPSPS